VRRGIFSLAALFAPLFSLVVTLIGMQPYRNDELHALLMSADCIAPCWQGIRPGETTLDEAITLMQRRAWVDKIRFHRGMAMDTGMLIWSWGEGRPALVNAHKDGLMWIERNIVANIQIGMTARLGDVWLTLARPDGMTTTSTSAMPPQVVSAASYKLNSILIIAPVLCPARQRAFWYAPVDMIMDTDDDLSGWLVTPMTYHMPVWMTCS
jgi:hypothetical protein